ncbi:MAG: peptide ABC transporter substrate-binding protein [Alkalispirochaeta sp.]
MKKTILVVGLTALLVSLVFVSCGPKQEGKAAAAPAEEAEFIIGNGAEPESLDPHLVSGVPEHRIMMGIYEGLVVPDPEKATAQPGVAESWTISEDGTEYTFTIRSDAQWSDGEPITAQQVYDSWIRVLAPDLAAPYAWFPSMFIKGAAEFNAGEAGPESVAMRVIDDKTFQFETVGPLPYTLDALAHYSFAIVPTHAIEKFGSEWTLPENHVGNGPYLLSEWSPQQRIVLTPNPNYWNAGKVKLDRVVFLPVDDNTTAHNMYLNGEMDWSTDVPAGQIEAAQLRDDFQVSPYLGTYYYVFNNGREPLNDPRVRKALSMAFDRDLLVSTVTKAGELPAYSIVADMTGYPAIDGLGDDYDTARQLLADAGFPGGKGFPALSILYNTHESHKAIAEFIQEQWRENLGINVTLENQEWATYLASRRAHTFDIARAGWIGDYQDPNTFLDMFVTGGAMNGGQYSNSEYDRLIGKAARMAAGPDRFETLRQAEKIFIEEDMGIMPIYFYVNKDMIDLDKWDGWYANIMGWHPVGDIAES